MKLIKVEAHGFKSFADPIVLKFDGGVAGIVGPNGSGKSNINDAIKWVLGERSAKELRGDNMEDVIFAGSKTAKPMQKAVVTLTFDNRDGLNDHPHEFITISRSVERGTGNNQYYLNGEECRYRDIKELAMESGIGKSSLAIISQGTVSDIAEATVDERKLIFEEAAGVSKYKFRKKEAQTKLDKTEEGLEKIRLVISEIERKLIPLRKQAEKAKLFIAKSEELKGIEIGLLVDRIKFFGEQYQSLSVELEGVNETKSDLNQRIKEAEDRISENIAYKNSLNSDLSKMIDEYENIKSRINSLEIVRAREEEKAKLLSEGKLQVTKEEEIKAYESFLEKSLKQLKFYENQSKVIQDRILNTKTILENHDNELNALNISVQKKKTELATVQSHIQLLKQQIESNSMLFKGTKTILENKVIFGKSLKGTVAELISVDSNYALAIEAVLNNALQHIVVDKSETAVKAVNFLKSNKGGRATFIPLASIQPKSVRDDHLLAIQGHPGFVGIANDLIKIDKTYDLLAKFLLGNIIVATDIDQANKMSHILDNRYMIVTLDGDTIRAGGVIMGGTKNTNATLLTIEEKLKELEALIPNLNTSISINEMKIREIANKRRSAYELKSQLENQNLLHQNDWRNEQARFDEFNEKLKNISNRELNKNSLDLNKESNESDYETLLSKRISLEADINSKRVSINTLSIDIDSQTKMKNDFDATLRKLLDTYSTKIASKEKAHYILTVSRDRLASQYKLTFESAVQQGYILTLPVEEAEEIVANLRDEIEKIGSVNLEALEQLVEEEQRYNEYAVGERELSEAKDKLVSAIADMDKIITTRLSNIIHDVNEEFNNVFRTMFGGGSARLFFTDQNNILDSGVDIEATPPGKNIKNLRLFSGGEKSLIAISLLFAILKARPLPLCILDEVEAALDEANVVRYAEYLQQLKPKTQFLVITHRHGTMSRVDSLFGATMQNRGVTSFFSIQLAEAKKIVEDVQVDYITENQKNKEIISE